MKSVNNKNNFILKFYCIIVAGLIFSCYIFANNKLPDPELKEKVSQWKSQQPVRFLENKGQMADADNIPIPFVLFKASANDIDVYITEKGVTYVFTKVEEETSTPISVTSDRMNGIREEENVKAEMAWINVQLKGVIIKKENIVKEGESAEHFNFFYSHCPDGIYNVKQYEKITIKNVYPDIDWVFYNSNETGMKYDFIVRPGADPSQIKLIYESENVLTINKDGNINIKTPLGTLTENAPYSYIEESGVEVKCDFTKKAIDRHNVEVGFNLNWPTNPGEGGNPCPESTLVIDPQLVWGTLYGGNGADGIRCLEVDNNNNLFAGGYTYSTNFPLQDAGTYFQVVKGINYDASILRFGNAGNLIWATFYGGSGSYEGINTIAIDANNNIFVGGDTDGIIFPVQNSGTFFQGARSGTYDAFILKFNNT
ncbi:MAG: hypothetical protein IT235_08765, partial [Bacteroidia bacterium]|nr:hypothetical protein [Bacteroidia bacterium]